MGLKKTGSRSTRIGSESYRCTLSRSMQPETGKISVIIEPDAMPGNRIAVRVPCRDFWLDFSDLRDAPPAGFTNAYRPVTPAMVRKVICAAIAVGWLPTQRQKPLHYEWTEEEKLIPVDKSKWADPVEADRPWGLPAV